MDASKPTFFVFVFMSKISGDVSLVPFKRRGMSLPLLLVVGPLFRKPSGLCLLSSFNPPPPMEFSFLEHVLKQTPLNGGSQLSLFLSNFEVTCLPLYLFEG
ncbi:hypothetical protein Ancab_019867 [Ancistrocladus abbreviatus]